MQAALGGRPKRLALASDRLATFLWRPSSHKLPRCKPSVEIIWCLATLISICT